MTGDARPSSSSSSMLAEASQPAARAPIDSVASRRARRAGAATEEARQVWSGPTPARATGSDGVCDPDNTPESTHAVPSPPSAAGALAIQSAAQDGTGPPSLFATVQQTLVTFAKFIGPGFMIAVAYSTHLSGSVLLFDSGPLLTRKNSRPGKLRDRHSRRSILQISPLVHRPAQQSLRHSPAGTLAQAWKCHGSRLGTSLPCLSSAMAKLLSLLLGRSCHYCHGSC